jgi:hypothetical protein
MVARDTNMIMACQELKTGVRLGAVTNRISQAPYLVNPPLAFQVLKHSFEGSQVSMNIGQNRMAHNRILYHPWNVLLT